MHDPWVDLDSFGSKEVVETDGVRKVRWVVNIPMLKDFLDRNIHVHLVSGTCDNFAYVIAALAPEYALSFYIAIAEPALYRLTMAAKAAEQQEKSLPSEWTATWLAKSKLSDVQIANSYEESAWGTIVAFAAGLQMAEELVGYTFHTLPTITEKFKVWAKSQESHREQILDAVMRATVSTGYVYNPYVSGVEIQHGWHEPKHRLSPRKAVTF